MNYNKQMSNFIIIDHIDFGIPLICISSYSDFRQTYYSLDEFNSLICIKESIICHALKNLEKQSKLLLDKQDVYDIRVLYNSQDNISSLCSLYSYDNLDKEIEDIKKKFNCVLRACRNSKVDYRKVDIRKVIPSWIIEKYFLSRAKAIRLLFQSSKNKEEILSQYRSNDRKFLQSIIKMEKNNVLVDGIFKEINISQVRAKTGRMKIDGGFNCHGIEKKQETRNKITSRFEDGLICSIDYNAIDYRCIIHSCDDENIKSIYRDSEDFHTTTFQLLLGKKDISEIERKIIKHITYSFLYGSSRHNIETLYPDFNVKDILNKFSESLRCVIDLQNNIYDKLMADGFIVSPMGSRVSISDFDHKGKVLGLYAQTFSSHVFEKAFIYLTEKFEELNLKSKIIFVVHDEFVIDCVKEEKNVIQQLSKELETLIPDLKFKVNVKFGKDYYEASMM